jgi:hypothetical protein
VRWKETIDMNSYWLSKSAETESMLDNLRVRYEQMKLEYEQRIAELERELLEANCKAQFTGVKNEK